MADTGFQSGRCLVWHLCGRSETLIGVKARIRRLVEIGPVRFCGGRERMYVIPLAPVVASVALAGRGLIWGMAASRFDPSYLTAGLWLVAA